jgi:single-strand DNA-binding protein
MTLPYVVIDGALGADPELRFSPSGTAVGSFRVASAARTKNKDTNEWEDGPPCWLTVKCFKGLAENVAESLVKGDRAIVTGRLQQEDWEDRDGNKRTTYSVLADTVSPSLQFRTTQHSSRQRSAPGQQQGQQHQQQGQQPQSQGQAVDPWAPTPAGDQPPF